MSTILFSVFHIYGLLLLRKTKMKQNESTIVFYILQERSYCCSKGKLVKVRISVAQRVPAAGIFVAGLMFSGEIYAKVFYLIILGKYFEDFEALVAEFRPNILPNPLFPNLITLLTEERLH